MKKVFCLLSLVGLIQTSCNRLPSANSTLPPWSGVKPASATIDGVNYFAKTGIFAPNAVPLPSTIITTKTDTSYIDSSFIIKTLGLVLPNGGGAVGTSIVVDSANKEYVITYNTQQRSMRSFNPNALLAERTYSTSQSIEGCRMKVYTNSATEIAGTFYGNLGRLDRKEEIFIDNGYYSITK